MVAGLPAKKQEVQAMKGFEFTDAKIKNQPVQELIGVLKARAKNAAAKRGELVILEDEPKLRAAVWAYIDARDCGNEVVAKKLAEALKKITIQVVVLKDDKDVFYKNANEREFVDLKSIHRSNTRSTNRVNLFEQSAAMLKLEGKNGTAADIVADFQAAQKAGKISYAKKANEINDEDHVQRVLRFGSWMKKINKFDIWTQMEIEHAPWPPKVG